jgi:AraC-like DNA-binding protein
MQSVILNFSGTMPTITNSEGQTYLISGDLILGQHTRRFKTVMQGKLDFIGVHFFPTALYRLIKKPMRVFADNIQPLKAHVGWYKEMHDALGKTDTTQLRVSVLEAFIADNLLPMTSTIEAVEKAAQLIHDTNGATPLTKVTREIGLSERSMQRYFSEYIGVSPKAFARVARFNGVTRLMETEPSLNWHTILLEAGYSDAAHFANDFKTISGQTPTEYFKGKTDYEKFFYGTP